MATKTTKSSAKSAKPSGRGGARPGAGRKPKAVAEMREALNSALNSGDLESSVAAVPRNTRPSEELREVLNSSVVGEVVRTIAGQLRAGADLVAEAIGTLRLVMLDDLVNPKDRIAAAREILNRTVGRSREAAEPREDGDEAEHVHLFVPDNGRDAAEAEAC